MIIIITAAITAIIVTKIADPNPISCRFAIIAQHIINPIKIAIISHINELEMNILTRTISAHITKVQRKAVRKDCPNPLLSASTKLKPIIRNNVINIKKKTNNKIYNIIIATEPLKIWNNIFYYTFIK